MANLVSVEISTAVEMTHPRILHRVPPHLRENKSHLYDPVIVSLGPYHQGKSQFRQVEEMKDEVLNNTFASSAGGGYKDRGFYFNKILERVDEIRNFYGGVSSDKYDDKALAEMMLRDGCFVIYSMEMVMGDQKKHAYIVDRLGQSAVAFICRDFLLLENQIPFWIINLLMITNLLFGEALIYKFLSIMNFGDDRLKRVPCGNKGQEPLHLLEAHRLAFIKEDSSTVELGKMSPESSRRSRFGMSSYPYGSATELIPGGIQFRPSSRLLDDIRFTSGRLWGYLHLPVLVCNTSTKVFLSNVIALEMSPANNNSPVISSYINFMKSFIMKPEDVTELRRRRILVNCLGNDNNVVKMLEEISSDGTNNVNIFEDVLIQIREHCNKKFKVGMSCLLYSCDRHSWAISGFLISYVALLISYVALWYDKKQTDLAERQNHGKQN